MYAKPLKVYVGVRVDFNEDGLMLPLEINWEDGRRFRIDRVTDIRRAAALRAGGCGDRYTVCIGGRRSFLFFERIPQQSGNFIGRWFVERKTVI